MTRHAKASSAGSTQGQGSRSGSFVRGAGATRGCSSDATGSGARSYRGRLVTFSFAAALLALALFASSAFASKQAISSFGSQAGSGSRGGEFNNPRDIAVNESGAGPANAGDTYVADEANNRIERFDSAGNFVSAWGKDTIAPAINERQRIVTDATEGTYTLTFKGATTGAITYYYGDAYSALANLPTVGGYENIEVLGRGTSGDPMIVTFKGALAGTDLPTISIDGGQLTGRAEVSTIVNGGPSSDDTGSGFEICTVAAECRAGTASGENGALSSPQSVAVDQDTGNVYVSDRGNRRVDEYDGEGNFIRAFGFDVAESGPGDTGTEYEVCNEEDGDTCKEGVAGPGVGQYGEGYAERGFGITVSPADSNVSSGTVYLADSGNRRVDTFDLDGTSPSSFGSSVNFGEEQPRGVAVDSRGIVYASDSREGGDIQRYDSKNVDGGGVGFLAPIVPLSNEQQEITFTGFGPGETFKLTCPDGTLTEELVYAESEVSTKFIRLALEKACGANNVLLEGEPPKLTVTFKGALGGANQPQMTCTSLGAGSCSVTTTSEGHPGPLLAANNASSATRGLAVNPAGTALYVLRVPGEGGTVLVQQFGPTNEPGLSAPPSAVDDAHGAAANFGAESYAVQGFGFDGASGRFYISFSGDLDGYEHGLPSANRVYVLDDVSSLPSPTVNTPTVTGTAARTVTFNGEVDPKGGLVECTFQYSTDETNWKDVSAPSCGFLNQNGGTQEIKQSVFGLDPDTHYFVRLQVTRPYFSGFTPVVSAAQGFTTASGPPLVSAAKVRAVDDRSARVTAMIDPSHSPTTYVVEYGTSSSLGSTTEPVSVGSGTEPIEVSPVIGGLAASTKYYFKVVATNLVNSTASDSLTTATYPAPPSFGSCPNERFRTGPSAKLPDCRAYEQVTPGDKYGSDASGNESSVEASAAGDGITSYTFTGFPGSEGFQYSNVFHSRFTGGEWETDGLNTPPSYGDVANVLAWTPDLRLSFTGVHDYEGAPGDKLVMRDSADGSRDVLIPQGVGFTEGWFVLGGAFEEDSKVVFEANGDVPVTSGPAPTATETEQSNVYLYDRDSGELTLAGLLPDSACATPPCVPAEGSKFPRAWGYVQDGHVASSSGGIYFTDPATGQLYLRRDAAGPGATTVQVSASHRTNGGGSGGVATNSPQPATFQGATPDGSKAFLTSTEELTNDANTGPEPLLTPAIGRANIDGSGFQPSFIPTTAKWTAVDSGHIYWSNTAAGTIGRADIGGANLDPSFITGLESPEGIAVDSGHIYWAEARDHEEGHGTIGRSTLAGTSVEKEFITGASDPRGVAVNTEYVFWSNGATNYIGRSAIIGASPEQSFHYSENPWGIAVNATNVYVVQVRQYASMIELTLDGEFVNYESLGERIEARSVAIDSNYAYWSDMGNGRIGRLKLNFSNDNLKFITSVHGVFGVAADAGHVYWATNPSASDRPPSPGTDLYRYDSAGDELIDLAPDSADTNGAEVVGVLGYSNDGSHVYFAANADLDGAGPAQSGDCSQESHAGLSFKGSCSAYLWQADGAGTCTSVGGCVSFVAPLDAEGSVVSSDGYNWAGGEEDLPKTSRVSADGRVLVFRSQLKLTSYENQGALEFYRYDDESGQITCMTCNPTGVPSVQGAPTLKNSDLFHAPTSHAISIFQNFLSRNLSPDGNRFFFQSSDKLVPADVNGETSCEDSFKEEVEHGSGPTCRDVYEWEAPGTPGGSCTVNAGAYSPANGGCIYLISTGTGIYPTYLADVSESGNTVFIFSRQKLVPSDEDNQEDIYAVKVDGGLASQNAPRPANCEGDACRGSSSQPSSAPGAGSGVFEGPGNPKQSTNQTRCPKGKRTVHSKGKVRCVAKKHAKKHKSKAHKRAANTNRRASR